MKISSLFGALGIHIDKQSFARADDALKRLKNTARKTMDRVQGGLSNSFTAWKSSLAQGANSAFAATRGRLIKDYKGLSKDWRKTLDESTSTLFKGMAVGAGVVYAALQAIASGDQYNNAISRIRQLTDDVGMQVHVEERLFKSAQDTASEFGSVVKLYQQVGKGALDLGKSHDEAINIVETLNKAIKASGADAVGAEAALTQLSQGLGSGTLRGEEFNSVLEQAPIIIDLIAKSMGKTRGQMRKMAEAGALTSKVIFKALEEQAGAVDAAFKKRIIPVGDAFIQMRNSASQAFGRMLQDKEVAAALGQAIQYVGVAVQFLIEKFGVAVKWLAAHGDVVKAVLIVLAAAFAAVAVKAAAAWLAIFGPITLVLAALAALVLYWDDIVAAFVSGIEWIVEAVSWVADAFMGLRSSILRALKSVFMWLWRMGSGVRDFFVGIFDWIMDKLATAADYAVETLKAAGNAIIDAVNFLPGVNIDPMAVGNSFKAGLPRASRVPAAAAVGGSNQNITMGPTNITVNSNAKDPSAVASEVVKQQRTDFDRRLRAAGDPP
jgi:tape measure domain-containing protein